MPTVFTPHTVDGRPLLDGGILNPVPIAPTLQDRTDAIIAVSLSGVPRKMGGGNRRAKSAQPARPAEKLHHRYQKKIEDFIDQLQERLGFSAERGADDQSFSLTDAALMSLDAMQASIARCMLAAYPPDLLIEIPINTCGAHEFYRAREVIDAGEYWAGLAIERFIDRSDA